MLLATPASTTSKDVKMKNPNDTFTSIELGQLATVSGGAARVAASGKGGTDQQLQLMLTQIGDAIKEVGKNQGGMGDMMPMMMMMMMMGGGGGGAAAAPPPPPPPPQGGTYIKVNVR
jgi:hypothetical protein